MCDLSIIICIQDFQDRSRWRRRRRLLLLSEHSLCFVPRDLSVAIAVRSLPLFVRNLPVTIGINSC